MKADLSGDKPHFQLFLAARVVIAVKWKKNKYTPTINRWLIKIWGALSIQKLSTLKRHLHNKCLDMLSPFIDYLKMCPLA